VDAFRTGRFVHCLGALRGNTSNEALALGTRALLRLRRFDEALGTAERGLERVSKISHRERGELEMLRAATLANLQRLTEAQCGFDDARAYVQSATSPALEAEFDYFEALLNFSNHDLARCERGCRKVLAPAPFVYRPADHFVPIEHARARAHGLLGTLAAARSDFAAQAMHLKRSLAEIENSPVADAWFRAAQLANVATFARESGAAVELAFVRERFEAIAWIPELMPLRYDILNCLAWASALNGDHLGAFRDLRGAIESAPSAPLKIAACVDKAFLARELRQDLVAREELDYAERLSDSVCWSDTADREIDVLVRFSQALAPENPRKARRLFDLYLKLRDAARSQHPAYFDERSRLSETVAEGVICRAEGKLARAAELLRHGFVRWRALGYHWRAAVVAIELAELGAGRTSAAFLAEQAALRPNSWIALRAQALLGSAKV